MFSELGRRFWSALHDEDGIETLEWIAIAVLIIVGVAVVLYAGPLYNAVSNAITNVSTHIG